MSTKPSGETRHRWTPAERDQLIADSKRFATVVEATDALYAGMGLPERVVHAQLYELYLKGRVPHLQLSRKRDTGLELSPAVIRAVRELARAMRVEGISDALVTVGETIKVQVTQRRAAIDIEFL